jgi:hypothetical protein
MAQEPKRDQTVRLPNPSAQPFVAALKTARFFAVLFFWVAMVCTLAHVAAFVLLEWTPYLRVPAAEAAPGAAPAARAVGGPGAWLGLLESAAGAAQPGELFRNVQPEQTSGTPAASGDEAEGEAAPASPAPEQPAGETGGEEAAAPPEEEAAKPGDLTDEQRTVRARNWRRLASTVLRPARVVGILSSILLAVTVFLYLQIALLGRLSGIRQLTRSLFLLLLFLVTVLPWGTVFEDVQASSLYDFDRLVSDHALGLGASKDWAEAGLYYGRYFVFPVVSALLLSLAGIHFAGGYSRSVLANE